MAMIVGRFAAAEERERRSARIACNPRARRPFGRHLCRGDAGPHPGDGAKNLQ